MKRLIFLLFMILPQSGWAENAQHIQQLEKELARVQQEAQATHQQFLMVQELRRNETFSTPPTDLPDAATQTTPIPKYEDMIQRQQERKNRIDTYTTELDRLYARFNVLNDERQALMEQIKSLEQLPTSE